MPWVWKSVCKKNTPKKKVSAAEISLHFSCLLFKIERTLIVTKERDSKSSKNVKCSAWKEKEGKERERRGSEAETARSGWENSRGLKENESWLEWTEMLQETKMTCLLHVVVVTKERDSKSSKNIKCSPWKEKEGKERERRGKWGRDGQIQLGKIQEG